eukprot:2789017-Prymnesium_polylepis.1
MTVAVRVPCTQLRLGRYRACQQGLSAERIAAQRQRLDSHGFIRLQDTAFVSWQAMYEAAEKDTFVYKDEVLDDPLLPKV